MTMKRQRQGGFLIAKVHQVAGRIFARMLKEHQIDEINPAQGRIMFVLWREDGISINELAKRTSLGKSTLTSMLDRLEEAGYLVRVPSKEDRRRILIKRTDKDKALENVYVRVSQEMTKLFYDGFSSTEIHRFEEDLQRILDNLTEFEATAE
ncbi:MAG: MarR family transcriptional regulator [Phycisphaerales bacterium]|nr:MAG: MarR family transcriptional regulator [Phycisphaerales bacterium]